MVFLVRILCDGWHNWKPKESLVFFLLCCVSILDLKLGVMHTLNVGDEGQGGGGVSATCISKNQVFKWSSNLTWLIHMYVSKSVEVCFPPCSHVWIHMWHVLRLYCHQWLLECTSCALIQNHSLKTSIPYKMEEGERLDFLCINP